MFNRLYFQLDETWGSGQINYRFEKKDGYDEALFNS